MAHNMQKKYWIPFVNKQKIAIDWAPFSLLDRSEVALDQDWDLMVYISVLICSLGVITG
jgi:hypothetical protein